MKKKMREIWKWCAFSSIAFFILMYYFIFSDDSSPKPYKSLQTKQPPTEHSLKPLLEPKDVSPKLYVVEEHQEVLHYWSEAFAHGVFPPNSTLLHIDAHPDDSLPKWISDFPNFRPPRSKLEVASMIQSNDAFIRAAQMSHMLSRFVWIPPFWADENNRNYTKTKALLGSTIFRGQKAACECVLEFKHYTCAVFDFKSNESEPMVTIPSKVCDFRQRFKSEVVRDSFAVILTRTVPRWLYSKKLLLDIDLDFFGVRLVGRHLLTSGLPWSTVTEISNAIGKMLCPSNASDEPIVDRWFFRFLTALLNNCHSNSSVQPWCSDRKAAVDKFFKPFRAHPRFSKIFCTAERSPEVDFKGREVFLRIWTILYNLTTSQQLEVRRAGICVRQSMRSAFPPPEFHLCIGSNEPNNSAVSEHYPSSAELSRQFTKLRTILTLLPTRPLLITLVRSSRDGYVPRDLQAEIESNVMKILRDIYQLKEEDIVYDDLLMNGRQGDWYRRTY